MGSTLQYCIRGTRSPIMIYYEPSCSYCNKMSLFVFKLVFFCFRGVGMITRVSVIYNMKDSFCSFIWFGEHRAKQFGAFLNWNGVKTFWDNLMLFFGNTVSFKTNMSAYTDILMLMICSQVYYKKRKVFNEKVQHEALHSVFFVVTGE